MPAVRRGRAASTIALEADGARYDVRSGCRPRPTSTRPRALARSDPERGAVELLERCVVARRSATASAIAVDALAAAGARGDRGRDGRARSAGGARARPRLPGCGTRVRGRVRHRGVPPAGARRARGAPARRRCTRSPCTTTGASATSCACRAPPARAYLELVAERGARGEDAVSDFLVNLARRSAGLGRSCARRVDRPPLPVARRAVEPATRAAIASARAPAVATPIAVHGRGRGACRAPVEAAASRRPPVALPIAPAPAPVVQRLPRRLAAPTRAPRRRQAAAGRVRTRRRQWRPHAARTVTLAVPAGRATAAARSRPRRAPSPIGPISSRSRPRSAGADRVAAPRPRRAGDASRPSRSRPRSPRADRASSRHAPVVVDASTRRDVARCPAGASRAASCGRPRRARIGAQSSRRSSERSRCGSARSRSTAATAAIAAAPPARRRPQRRARRGRLRRLRARCAATRRGRGEATDERLPRHRRRERDAPDAARRPHGAARRHPAVPVTIGPPPFTSQGQRSAQGRPARQPVPLPRHRERLPAEPGDPGPRRVRRLTAIRRSASTCTTSSPRTATTEVRARRDGAVRRHRPRISCSAARCACCTTCRSSPTASRPLRPPSGTIVLHESLRDEFEHVKLTLEPLTLEDVTKVWTALALRYRLSAAYVVNVVQIESRRPRRFPRPVGQPLSPTMPPLPTDPPSPGPMVYVLTIQTPTITDVRVRRLGDDRRAAVPYARDRRHARPARHVARRAGHDASRSATCDVPATLADGDRVEATIPDAHDPRRRADPAGAAAAARRADGQGRRARSARAAAARSRRTRRRSCSCRRRIPPRRVRGRPAAHADDQRRRG